MIQSLIVAVVMTVKVLILVAALVFALEVVKCHQMEGNFGLF
jgi:hypothetical protein